MFNFFSKKNTKKSRLQDAIKGRIEEVQSYQINIDNYTRMLADLPKEWRVDLLSYKRVDVQSLAALDLTTETRNLIADLLFKDQLEILLIGEKLQQRRAQLVLKVLEDQINEGV